MYPGKFGPLQKKKKIFWDLVFTEILITPIFIKYFPFYRQ